MPPLQKPTPEHPPNRPFSKMIMVSSHPKSLLMFVLYYVILPVLVLLIRHFCRRFQTEIFALALDCLSLLLSFFHPFILPLCSLRLSPLRPSRSLHLCVRFFAFLPLLLAFYPLRLYARLFAFNF
jgi:hypothetical protein